MDEYKNQLKEIDEINRANLSMSPSDVHAEQAKEYYRRMIESQRIAEEAPTNAANAELQYYTFVDPDFVDKSLVLDAPKVKGDIEKKHKDILQTVNSSIDNYTSQLAYIGNIPDVYSNLQNNITQNTKIRDTNRTNNTTNQQRVYYLNQEYETLDTVNYILFLACIGFIGSILDTIYEDELWVDMESTAAINFIALILFTLFVGSTWFDEFMIYVMAGLEVVYSYRPIIYATY